MRDTPAGDVDYSVLGTGYAQHRRPDPRIAAMIHGFLGDARCVLNVGAGAGSYEPSDRHVIAIEPAAAMRAQRPRTLVPAIDAVAEKLPLDDGAVDASMAIVTVHQWRDLAAGLRELVRVTRGAIILMVFDGDAFHRCWLHDYAPELTAVERTRDPAISILTTALSAHARQATVHTVPIPIDCTDGFTEAFYARPEKFLEPGVMRAQSCWSFVEQSVKDRFVATLRRDLASGAWDARYGMLRTQPTFDGSLRLVVSTPA